MSEWACTLERVGMVSLYSTAHDHNDIIIILNDVNVKLTCTRIIICTGVEVLFSIIMKECAFITVNTCMCTVFDLPGCLIY